MTGVNEHFSLRESRWISQNGGAPQAARGYGTGRQRGADCISRTYCGHCHLAVLLYWHAYAASIFRVHNFFLSHTLPARLQGLNTSMIPLLAPASRDTQHAILPPSPSPSPAAPGLSRVSIPPSFFPPAHKRPKRSRQEPPAAQSGPETEPRSPPNA